jgi:hypothetical protein
MALLEVRFGGKVIQATRELSKWTAAGCPTVDSGTLSTREATCALCPHYQPAKSKCGLCGCGHLKLRLATSVCPDGRW